MTARFRGSRHLVMSFVVVALLLTGGVVGWLTRSKDAVVSANGTVDKIVVSPARHLSEQQVADIASRALPGVTRFSCQFKDGVWDILAVQNDVWVSSVTTNADGRVIVRSTNAMQLVLRVRDKDGQVELVKKH